MAKKKTAKKSRKTSQKKSVKNPFANFAKDTGERASGSNAILHHGDSTRFDGTTGVDRVMVGLPSPENKTQAEQLVKVALERAERIYRDELTGGAPTGLRKGMRSPGKSTIELAQRWSFTYGLPTVPSASLFRSQLRAQIKAEASA